MNYVDMIISFFGSSTGKIVAYAVGIAILLGYIFILKGNLETAIEEKKYAEDNVVLVTREFDRVLGAHDMLVVDRQKDKEFFEFSTSVLVEKHQKDLAEVIAKTTIIEGIKNANDKDDGNISNVLNSTLDALRMLD